jgi:hypothetical protein
VFIRAERQFPASSSLFCQYCSILPNIRLTTSSPFACTRYKQTPRLPFRSHTLICHTHTPSLLIDCSLWSSLLFPSLPFYSSFSLHLFPNNFLSIDKQIYTTLQLWRRPWKRPTLCRHFNGPSPSTAALHMPPTPLTYPTPPTEAPEATEVQLSEVPAVESAQVNQSALPVASLRATRASPAFPASRPKTQTMTP